MTKAQEIVSIIDYLEKKKLPEDWEVAHRILSVAKKGYFVLDNVLYYESSDVQGRRRLVVPEILRDQVVAEHHDELLFAGHFSVKKTLQKLKLYFYWPGMSSSVFKK